MVVFHDCDVYVAPGLEAEFLVYAYCVNILLEDVEERNLIPFCDPLDQNGD
jgi:hypothetical protein